MKKVVQKQITTRSVLIGASVAIFVNLASPYTESVGFSNFSWSYLPEGAAIPMLLILAINALILNVRKKLSLTQSELLVIFVMGLVSNATSIWLIYFFLAAIVSPLYFASPENEWQHLLLPHLPDWLIIGDINHAVQWFYEGLPSGAKMPWQDWIIPLTVWSTFFVALILASYTLIAFFHQQWIEREKLAYPLMQPILHLTEGSRHPELSVWLNPLLWLGVTIPFSIAVLDVCHHIKPQIPSFPVDHLGSLNWGSPFSAPGLSSLACCINFIAIGVGYFVPQDVLLSIWLLYLLIKVGEVSVLSYTGKWYLGSGGMFVWGNAAIAWQSFGAFIVFVVFFIYRARQHLWQFVSLSLENTQPDQNRLMSPRSAMITFGASIVFMLIWLTQSGLQFKISVVFIPLLMLIYLGISRVICQSGIFYVVPPMIAQNPCIHLFSPRRIGAQGMSSLGLTYAWHGDVQSVVSGLSAEGVKLQSAIGCTGRQLTGLILLALGVGLLVAPWGVIFSGYWQGAINWNTWLFRGFGPNTYGQVLTQLESSMGQEQIWQRLVYFGIGGLLTVGLTIMYYQFLWWPIHPIGLAIISSFTLYTVYLGFFITWACKHTILRWGGLRLYARGIPFFIGLLIGHYLGRAVALTIYTIYGLQFA